MMEQQQRRRQQQLELQPRERLKWLLELKANEKPN